VSYTALATGLAVQEPNMGGSRRLISERKKYCFSIKDSKMVLSCNQDSDPISNVPQPIACILLISFSVWREL